MGCVIRYADYGALGNVEAIGLNPRRRYDPFHGRTVGCVQSQGLLDRSGSSVPDQRIRCNNASLYYRKGLFSEASRDPPPGPRISPTRRWYVRGFVRRQ